MLKVKKLYFLSSVATLSLLGAQAGLAADMPATLPTKAQAFAPIWTGFYGGVHGGYSWGSLDGDMTHDVVVPAGSFQPFNFSFPGGIPFPSLNRGVSPRGALGGLQAGYNFQTARVVYGIEADISWTGQRDTFNFSGQTFFSSEDYAYDESLRAKLKYFGTLRGRWGYAFDQFLPYVTGGFAWGRMEVDLDWSLTQLYGPTATFSGSQSRTLLGWTLGAGFEYAFAQKWSAKAEYLYLDLGKETYFSGIQGGGAFGLRDHILRFGLNFRN
jgi:outer membrane immunogenic protein